MASEHRIRTRYRSNRPVNGSHNNNNLSERRHHPPPSIILSHIMDTNEGGISNPAFADEGGGRETPSKEDSTRLCSPNLNAKKLGPRSKTQEALKSGREQRRATILKKCRDILENQSANGKFSHMDTLLQNRNFTDTFFELFDTDASCIVSQQDFFEILRVNLHSERFSHKPPEFRADVVELFETVTYLIHKDDDLNTETFYKVINSKGIANKLYILADYDKSGDMDVEEMMDFILKISKPIHVEDFNMDQVKLLRDVFQKALPKGQDQLTMKEFKQIMTSKNAFFLERAFKIFDQDGNGTISMTEFFESMNTFAAQGPTEKITFLFKIYDIDGDGALQLEEIESIIRASLTESGMKLPESDIQALAFGLYDEALGEDGEDTGEINIDQLTTVFANHEGLLEGLNLSLAKWLTPQRKEKKKPPLPFLNSWRDKLSSRHIKQNWQFFTFLFFLFAINVILFVTRAVYFKDFATLTGATPNGFYMMSRANGRTLLFNSMMILVLVLRYTITKMRDLGLNQFLPIDNNIYLHKLLGIVSFIQAWFHTIMHICNFSINVAPDPVKFVQLTNKYWAGYNPDPSPNSTLNWLHLNYQIPEGCEVVNVPERCPPGSLIPEKNVSYCQVCEGNATAWNVGDWLFTMKPGVFGIIGGIANPTGFALIFIFTIMFICSLPFVRKSGHFQVFYFTHLMYWAYFVLLILHAPEFWKWVIVPLSIYVIERLYRGLSTIIGQGKSHIVEGIVLPSRVTRLDIYRPPNFRFNPGDWVFIRIPKIATYEWHPFTISSAPERSEVFTLHIRGVGQWTNRLYNFFEERKQEINAESRRQSMKHRHGDSMKKKNSLYINMINDDIPHPIRKKEKLEVHIDGPFGAPASSIFRAEHAVLIATGIGVTPFSSILQSIMSRYYDTKRECPKCTYKWSDNLGRTMMNLKKVDFIWINRDQKSFEWFTKLLHQIELEQVQDELQPDTIMNKFMDIHMYFTAALQKTDMRAIGLQVALDILHKKEKRDLVTGLKAKTNAGRPHWNRVFSQLKDQNKGRITVFYCGNPHLAKILREKCEEFGFAFRKEVF